MVKNMAFVAYSVKDVPRATAFYRDIIGLVPGESSFGDAWIEFEVGDATFGIGNGESIGIAPGSQFSAAFEVDDVKAMRDRLVAQNVSVSSPIRTEIASRCTSARCERFTGEPSLEQSPPVAEDAFGLAAEAHGPRRALRIIPDAARACRPRHRRG
jgi:extradiol dioxygenase family protein